MGSPVCERPNAWNPVVGQGLQATEQGTCPGGKQPAIPDRTAAAGREGRPGRAGPKTRSSAPLRGPLPAAGRDQAAAMSAGKGETTPRNEPRAHPPRFWKGLKAQTARDTQLA